MLYPKYFILFTKQYFNVENLQNIFAINIIFNNLISLILFYIHQNSQLISLVITSTRV